MSGNNPELVLEIVELEDGELAIRDADSGSEPIMKINFSEEIREKLNDQCLEVARVMLTAGIQMVAESGVDLSNNESEQEQPAPTIH
ncbi:hypothetical protein [Neptuniibacter caesariensis]|uniref:Uncharacterized protein n=1 Tax=Neptuniibacter caesariensis TaxID=207954 RepID=A0A7U8GRT2_NEPCE|nr:hypothetical protein [Neptuniibacter caesariensis]EAR61722.1 hypothetical protein MED92_03967 [Neptuniibacter caesariensis]